MPGRIVFGDGALAQLAPELDGGSLRRAMLIVSARQPKLAVPGRSALGHRMALEWNEVRQHVPRDLAERATVAASTADTDVIVAIGGGSTVGLGKAVAVSTGLPLVAVPTTYAGSEMTPIYGLTSGTVKKTARDPAALPKIVVYDPRLLTALPASIVGPSGMNALAHCAEALWATNHDPITDALALDGAGRLQSFLRRAYTTTDLAARGEVLLAACLAGIALGTVGTSVHHALCHLFGGMCDAPHAETHAIVLPYVIRYLEPAIPDTIARVAEAMKCDPTTLADNVLSLARSVGTPTGLRAIGITRDQIDAVAEAAVAGNLVSPRPLDLRPIRSLLRDAWNGELPQSL
ncbi:maleylacetate reductase [Rhodococcus opacus]|uniref:maleylacetate reductase n=1 Tax=Rhodococcus opacus TaxID=37919 RepID=UPI0002A3CC23|nr:maleylacetate reductase [Rhodococcus opacus]ELB94124.1 maleylacetate reductase [Rhodococcus wratislaviensis IFP 2016]